MHKGLTGKILGLHDGKSGHFSQLKGILDALNSQFNYQYQVVNVNENSKNVFSALPNKIHLFFSKLNIFFVKKEISSIPNIIIAVGRRTMPLVLKYQYLAKKNNLQLKVIYLMPPCKNSETIFDLVFFHNYKKSNVKSSNLVSIDAPPHFLNQNILDKHLNSYKFIKSSYQRPYTTFIMGGKAKNIDLNVDSINEIYEYLIDVKARTKGSIFFITSRRTGKENEILLKKKLSGMCHFYGYYSDKQIDNPYIELLANSDYLIVSGESSSMISEAAYPENKKALYIFFSKSFQSNRYIPLHQNLYNKGYALNANQFSLSGTTKTFDVKTQMIEAIHKISKM